MNKVVRLGTTPVNGRRVSIYARITFKDGSLSIVGVEGPRQGGNCAGSCGQIVYNADEEYLAGLVPAPGWDLRTVREFFRVWVRWHLNDWRAGTPAQEAWLRENPGASHTDFNARKAALAHIDFGARKAALARAGLDPDNSVHPPYRYGSDWLTECVPQGVIGFLESLPPADKDPAWV